MRQAQQSFRQRARDMLTMFFTRDKKKLISYFEKQKQYFRNASVRELQAGNAPFQWVAKSLVVSPELNLSYVNGYLSEPDFIQLDVKKDLRGG